MNIGNRVLGSLAVLVVAPTAVCLAWQGQQDARELVQLELNGSKVQVLEPGLTAQKFLVRDGQVTDGSGELGLEWLGGEKWIVSQDGDVQELHWDHDSEELALEWVGGAQVLLTQDGSAKPTMIRIVRSEDGSLGALQGIGYTGETSVEADAAIAGLTTEFRRQSQAAPGGRPFLGVYLEEGTTKVTDVFANSPASKVGVGDGSVLLAIDGMDLDDPLVLQAILGTTSPGAKHKLTFTSERVVTLRQRDGATWLGVTLDEGDALVVSEVSANSPALEGGLESGDALVAINGSELKSFDDLRNAIVSGSNGEQVDVVVRRTREITLGSSGDFVADESADTQDFTLEPGEPLGRIEIVEEPVLRDAVEEPISNGDDRPWLGVTLSESEAGVMIAETFDDSPARRAGLKSGDVITELDFVELENVDGLMQGMARKRAGDQVQLFIERVEGNTEQHMEVVLRLGSRSQAPGEVQNQLGTGPESTPSEEEARQRIMQEMEAVEAEYQNRMNELRSAWQRVGGGQLPRRTSPGGANLQGSVERLRRSEQRLSEMTQRARELAARNAQEANRSAQQAQRSQAQAERGQMQAIREQQMRALEVEREAMERQREGLEGRREALQERMRALEERMRDMEGGGRNR